jgi:hypothetical protein
MAAGGRKYYKVSLSKLCFIAANNRKIKLNFTAILTYYIHANLKEISLTKYAMKIQISLPTSGAAFFIIYLQFVLFLNEVLSKLYKMPRPRLSHSFIAPYS